MKSSVPICNNSSVKFGFDTVMAAPVPLEYLVRQMSKHCECRHDKRMAVVVRATVLFSSVYLAII